MKHHCKAIKEKNCRFFLGNRLALLGIPDIALLDIIKFNSHTKETGQLENKVICRKQKSNTR